MTTLEFFKNQFESRVAEGYGVTKGCTINPEIDKDSYEWFKLAHEWFFGGAYDYHMKDVTDIDEMLEQKILKKDYCSSWRARQLGKTTMYLLTAKGLKTLYKMMH